MSRRLARQVAFQTLFQIDLANSDVETALEQRLDDAALDVDNQEYVKEVVRGVMQKLPALDAQISAVSKGWQVHRLGFVDRNILRLAIYEIVFMDEIPVRVAVNEAVELAKEFGDEESPKFINGLLGTVVRDGGFA
ncbi:MAG: transcription antitermination factor NusB [Limnochordia bacterium]|nr:transcription antitermination factor NusB [Limnochordia bacterium]MDI9465296.1 transcription antitermination factor NusB [Bacillota bacterium]NLO94732.1 transcription antitermination factor NusB [Bacillota bacterium]HAN94377.1 transcription antitermination factor NusB [Bacillota bacterium]HOB40020.1 transcription antitermination factor NusB [Limnochordia bacterium]